MNATMKQFEVMNEQQLVAVEGGKVNWGRIGMCALSVAAGAGQAYMSTAGGPAFLGPYAIGTGAIGALIGGAGAAVNC